MRINIIVILSIIFFVTSSVNAVEVNISCDDIDFIELSKSPPGMPFSKGFFGSCIEDCFMITAHLTDSGTKYISTYIKKIYKNPYTIYIGKIKILSISHIIGEKYAELLPIEYMNKVSDQWIFSQCSEARERASSICPGKQIKYTGVMGKKSNSN
jgi:hypothetical protein